MLVVICGLCSCYVVTPISRYLQRLLGADDSKRKAVVAPAENCEEANSTKRAARRKSTTTATAVKVNPYLLVATSHDDNTSLCCYSVYDNTWNWVVDASLHG